MALTNWRIVPMYGMRFVSHVDGSMVVEFPEGLETEALAHVASELSRAKHEQELIRYQRLNSAEATLVRTAAEASSKNG